MNDERLNFSENFTKSKRNLLWICTVIIFIYIAKLPTVVPIKIADVDFPINRMHLVILASTYFIYLLLSYCHEMYFAYRRNSQAGRTLEELDAKDFVERSISEISASIDLLNQNIKDIEGLKSNLPSEEPVVFDTIQYSYRTTEDLQNTLSLSVDKIRQNLQILVEDLCQKYGRNDDIINFYTEAPKLFYTSNQEVIGHFMAAKIEFMKSHLKSDLVESQNKFDDRMMILNRDLEAMKLKIHDSYYLIEKSSNAFLKISNTIHKISKFSFIMLDFMVPAVMSLIAAVIMVKFFCNYT